MTNFSKYSTKINRNGTKHHFYNLSKGIFGIFNVHQRIQIIPTKVTNGYPKINQGVSIEWVKSKSGKAKNQETAPVKIKKAQPTKKPARFHLSDQYRTTNINAGTIKNKTTIDA